jgi:hypothetical protein
MASRGPVGYRAITKFYPPRPVLPRAGPPAPEIVAKREAKKWDDALRIVEISGITLGHNVTGGDACDEAGALRRLSRDTHFHTRSYYISVLRLSDLHQLFAVYKYSAGIAHFRWLPRDYLNVTSRGKRSCSRDHAIL